MQLALLNALFRQGDAGAPDAKPGSPICGVPGYVHLSKPDVIEAELKNARIETECVIDLVALVDAVLREVGEATVDGRYTAASVVKLALGEDL